ncbi:MAG: TonB-dependent receptor domain-containing protein [Janthinobacterium lividum]
MLRYAFSNTRNVNDAFNTDDLSNRTARGSSFFADNSLNGTLTSAFTPALLNKFNFELEQRRVVERTGSSVTPGVLIPGIAQFGTPYAGNSRRFETHLEFSDTLLYQWRNHLLQAGANLDDVQLRSQVLDGQRGLFVFPTLGAFAAGAADFYTRSVLTKPDLNFREGRISGYVQDHWTPARSFTLDYGVRYDFNHLPAAPPQHSFNLSPRLGAAWSPFPSLVVRSGFGIFYDRFLLSTSNKLLQLDGQHGFTQIVEDLPAAALYRTGSSVSPDVPLGVWTPQLTLHNPYSEVASLSVEQALPLQTTLKGEYQFVHGVHLGRTTNINLLAPVVLTAMNAAALGVSSPTQQQIGRLAFPPSRLNPEYDSVNQFATSAGSSYSGGTVTLNRQFTDDLQILAGYSFSKTFDDASYDTEQPQNPYALGEERTLSLQDQRHRLTLSLASEYSRPWQQIGIYTLATGASLTRVLGQDHFPTDVLLGSVSGWLIGRYVYRTHHSRPRL